MLEAADRRRGGEDGAHGAQEELDNPSCPDSSKIGHTTAGAGVGSILTYVEGSLYLAGPYHGAPLSVVAITPAKAGPFDAGTVVVREALTLDPITARVQVDGAASDPIPHILKGIPLSLRDLRVYTDRPDFTRNPTDCTESHTEATLWGGGTIFDPSGESPHGLSARYQAANCAALGFKPRLGIKLKGGTRRGAFPALRAVYSPRPGDANLSRLALAFPRSSSSNRATSERSAPGCSSPPVRALAPSAPRARSTATSGPGARCSTNRSRARSTSAPQTTTCQTRSLPCTASSTSRWRCGSTPSRDACARSSPVPPTPRSHG